MKFNSDLHDVAIVVLNYKTPKLTIAAVKRFLIEGTKLRIVITDNASPDDSVKKFKDAFEGEERVFIVETRENGGYAKGNNFGIAFAESLDGVRYIGVMNPDVEIDGSSLHLLINALAEDSRIGLVTGRTIYNGKKLEPNPCAWERGGWFRWVVGLTLIGSAAQRICELLTRKELNRQGYYATASFKEDVSPVYAVQGCLFFARLDVWKKIGGFDERTFLYFEEDILAEKVLRAGLHNAVVRDAWIRHNHQEKDKSMQRQGERLFHNRCGFDSRMVFLREYSHYGWDHRTVLELLWRVDFTLRKLLIPLFYRK